MTFIDIIEHPSKLLRSFIMVKKDQRRKIKRLSASSGSSCSQNRQTKNLENLNEPIQRQNSSLKPPSIMSMSNLSRSISNRSITFASVFDEQDNENNNHSTFDQDTSLENEDLVIVVPNKYVLNEPILTNSNTEPYPFRSQIPLCLLPKSQSSMNITRSSNSKKKCFHLLARYHRPKKLSHPIKTIQSVNLTDQSKSTPDLLFSSSTITITPLPSPISTTNDHHRSLKTIRQWFRSSSVGRFIQSFIKHPTENTNNSNRKQLKQKSPVKLITSRKSVDLIY